MKHIVVSSKPEQLTPDQLDNGLFYGIISKTDQIGFFTKFGGKLLLLEVNHITDGNSWDVSRQYSEIPELVKNLLSIGFTIFAFDTAKELFQWIADVIPSK